ncbi:MAG: glutamine--fructose-6-phosphate transaminase (isomerizing) [Clostridia bacterium]|nr:glutamine--fructose-6-phosphate transaminase (isomerizing) [Clostridia bacterium]
MCGIIGYTGNNQAMPVIIKGLKTLEYRGYDSSGIALSDHKNFSVFKSEGKLENLIEKTKNLNNLSETGIGHTRWATHGKTNETNAHPHTSEDGMFTVVHNGIIENAEIIKEALESKGYRFISDTDTEVIPQLLSYHYDGNVPEAMRKTFSSLDGSFAVAILCRNEPGTIYAAKRQSPLVVGKGENENLLASDICALSEHAEVFSYLEDGEFAVIRKDSINFFDSSLKPIEKSFKKITTESSDNSKGNFEHYMLKEIFQQPEKIRNLLKDKIKNKKIFLNEIAELSLDITKAERLYIVACGSAYHAALAGKFAIEEMCRIPVEVDVASEFRYRNPPVSCNTPVIIISQSGETADSIAALRLANSRGAIVIGIVNVLPSTIANESDYVIATKAGREIAVATTKGYSTQVAALYMLALHIAGIKKTLTDKQLEFFTNELIEIPEKIEKILSDSDTIENISEKYKEKKELFFIGRNTDFAAAAEASLKLKEISYINSSAFAAGELKHGTIALIENNTPVVALCSNKQLLKKTLSNIEEAFSRGADILCVCKDKTFCNKNYKTIIIPDCTDIFTPLLEIIPMQLFAYYVAKKRGCDIDMPKNLAKSVTVE